MVLVDTSVWVEHLRKGHPGLQELLTTSQVLMHPFVLGELACGCLKNRRIVLRDLNSLPIAQDVTNEEVLYLLESRTLWGRGVGWIDAHLVGSALLTKCWFWTLDERLSGVAGEVGVQFSEHN